MIIERALQKQNDLCLRFVDFEKAFDTVQHEEMTRMLREIGVDGTDIRLIVNLYWDQKTAVGEKNEMTECVRIELVIQPEGNG